jgi:hypothetical protein
MLVVGRQLEIGLRLMYLWGLGQVHLNWSPLVSDISATPAAVIIQCYFHWARVTRRYSRNAIALRRQTTTRSFSTMRTLT